MRSERVPSVFFVSDCPGLHYNGVSLDCVSPSDAHALEPAQPDTRRAILSAVFTIQEDNDPQKQARQTQAEQESHTEPEANRVCQHCGALMPADASQCEGCGPDEFRPGERMQPDWAPMWLMSQEQSLWPERPPEIGEGARKAVKPPAGKRRPRAQAAQDFASNGFLGLPVTKKAANAK